MKPAAKPPRHPKEAVIRAAFARVLVELREKAGLTQAEVGEHMGHFSPATRLGHQSQRSVVPKEVGKSDARDTFGRTERRHHPG
jgi:hypothetical protein